MKSKILFFILLSMLLAIACNRYKTLDPYKWKSLDNASDSIMLELERLFNEDASDDSISRAIIEFEKINSVETDTVMKRVMDSRLLFWKARYAMKNDESDSALYLFVKAGHLNDSVRYAYDRMRIDNLRIPLSNSMDPEAYDFYCRSLDYARDVKDPALEARVCINIGNLLAKVGEAHDALEYYDMADSLNERLGYTRSVVKNKINRASAVRQIGYPDSSVLMLRSVAGDAVCMRDSATHSMVLRNLFLETDSIEYLRKAMAGRSEMQLNNELSGFCDGMMAFWFIRHGHPDSASIYSDRSVRNLRYVSDPNQRAIILLARSIVKMQEGFPDSAYLYRVAYEEQMDSALALRHSSDVMRMNALNEIKMAETRHLRQIYRRNMFIGALAFAFVLISTIVAIWLIRYNARQKLERVQRELALARTRCKADAATITIENQERVLSGVRDSLTDMRKTGNMKDSEMRRLETEIKLLLSESEGDRLERDMYEIIHPDFFNRLESLAPGLAQSYLKIAVYTLLELDNKRIAKLMNIRPESVRQSKWRLCRKIGKPDDISLEDYLGKINSDTGN